MALATQCPHCYTCFRVANDQLKLHEGLVRCGACQSTFNGIEHLLAPGTKPKRPPIAQPNLDEQPSTTTPVAASVEQTAIPAANTDNTDLDLDFELDFNAQFEHILDQDIKQEPSLEKAYGIDADIDAWATVGVTEPQIEAEHEAQHEELNEIASNDAANAAASMEHDTTDDHEDALHEIAAAQQEPQNDELAEETPDFVVQAEQQKKYGRLWRILLWISTPLLVLTAFGQASYLWRNELAAQLPQSKPWLVQACTVLNSVKACRISLPAQIEQISIESNELQTITDQANQPKIFALVLQLQNHSSTAQAWPSIELTLDDKKDKAVIRRVFAPNDYLPLKTDPTIINRGFAANAEQNVKLYFELEGVAAAGYRVGTYYP
jgi:predicted Zn finger-like uncharacterized protein